MNVTITRDGTRVNRQELVEWIKTYIKKHSCHRCKGTGSIGTELPWKYVCPDYKSTGLSRFAIKEKPSFDQLFKDVLKVRNMDDMQGIIEKYYKQLLVTEVLFGEVSEDALKLLFDRW